MIETYVLRVTIHEQLLLSHNTVGYSVSISRGGRHTAHSLTCPFWCLHVDSWCGPFNIPIFTFIQNYSIKGKAQHAWEKSSLCFIKISGNERCHTTNAPHRMSGTLFSNLISTHSMIPEDQNNVTTQWWSTVRHFTAVTQVLNTSSCKLNKLMKGKVLRKHSLHGKTAASGLFEAVHQWYWQKDAHSISR